MQDNYVECPELSGKTIQTLRIHKNTGDGTNVQVELTDGTSFSCCLFRRLGIASLSYGGRLRYEQEVDGLFHLTAEGFERDHAVLADRCRHLSQHAKAAPAVPLAITAHRKETSIGFLFSLIVAFGVSDLAAQGRLSKEQLLALITGVNLALVVLGFLLKPAGSSWSYGVFLALAASVVAFLPFGLPIIEARRRH